MKLTPIEEFLNWLKIPINERCGEVDSQTGLITLQRKRCLENGEFIEMITKIYIPSVYEEERYKQLGINGYERGD